MKLRSIKTVYDFMSYCRMPLWCQREIRDMKVGDIYFLGKNREWMGGQEEGYFIAEAWLEKERGRYAFFATWTIPTKESRPLIMTFGGFTVKDGGLILFDNDFKGVRDFARVSRYIDSMVRRMSHDERHRYYSAGSKPLFRGVWLDKNYIDRKLRVKRDGEKLRRYRNDYRNYAPEHQLEAIITAGILLKQIPIAFNSIPKDC